VGNLPILKIRAQEKIDSVNSVKRKKRGRENLGHVKKREGNLGPSWSDTETARRKVHPTEKKAFLPVKNRPQIPAEKGWAQDTPSGGRRETEEAI